MLQPFANFTNHFKFTRKSINLIVNFSHCDSNRRRNIITSHYYISASASDFIHCNGTCMHCITHKKRLKLQRKGKAIRSFKFSGNRMGRAAAQTPATVECMYGVQKRYVSETSHLLHLFVERCKIYGHNVCVWMNQGK